MSWLKDKDQVPPPVPIDETSNEPEWLRKMRATSTNYAPDAEIIQPLKRARKIGQATAPQMVAEKFASLVAILNDDDDTESSAASTSAFNLRLNNFDLPQSSTKIFYCSRTHSQLNQVTSELKKTDFFSKYSNSKSLKLASSIASRAQLCINKDILKKHSSNASITQACQELLDSESSCPYFNPTKDTTFKEHLNELMSRKVADIEDLLEAGQKHSCCAYYSGRYLLGPADIVTLPYNAILQRNTRQSLGINLKDSIVVFDEAHNIIDFVKQLNSVSISEPEKSFAYLHQCITTYLDRYYNRLNGANMSALSQLQCFFKSLENFCISHQKENQIFSLNDFIHSAGIETFNFSQLSHHIENTKLFIKVSQGRLKTDVAFISLDFRKRPEF